jgi:two-component system response regulator PilR (NtrC family)
MPQRILIVDDERAILSAMKDYLESYDWEVECGRDVEEAKLLLARAPFAVVIADLRLSPEQAIGGLDLIAHVRDSYPQTRTILLTAYGSSQVEKEARRIGVDAFLHKPQPLAEIVKIVYEVLG